MPNDIPADFFDLSTWHETVEISCASGPICPWCERRYAAWFGRKYLNCEAECRACRARFTIRMRGTPVGLVYVTARVGTPPPRP